MLDYFEVRVFVSPEYLILNPNACFYLYYIIDVISSPQREFPPSKFKPADEELTEGEWNNRSISKHFMDTWGVKVKVLT